MVDGSAGDQGNAFVRGRVLPIATRLVASEGADKTVGLITLLDLTLDQPNLTYDSVWNSFFASRVAVRQQRATVASEEVTQGKTME